MIIIIINLEFFGVLDCNVQIEVFVEWVKVLLYDDDKLILLLGEWEVNMCCEWQKQGILLDVGSWQVICDVVWQIGMLEEMLQVFCQQLVS